MKGSDLSMGREKSKGKGKMIICKRESCDTYVDNYLFLASVGFSLKKGKMAFALNFPPGAEEGIKNITLLTSQLGSTQDFLHQINELGKIVKVVFLGENALCLVKKNVCDWIDLEKEIINLVKDSYQDNQIEVYHESFGKDEREMAKAIRGYSGQRASELMIEGALSHLKKEFGIGDTLF